MSTILWGLLAVSRYVTYKTVEETEKPIELRGTGPDTVFYWIVTRVTELFFYTEQYGTDEKIIAKINMSVSTSSRTGL